MMKKICFTFLLLEFTSLLFCQNLDIKWLRSIYFNRNPSLDQTFIHVTNSVEPISWAMPLAHIGFGLLKKDKIICNKGFYLATSILTSAILSTSSKYLIDRNRPFETYPDIVQLSSAGSPSFPSGHTSAAFNTAMSMTLLYPKWYVGVPLFTYASLASYSRMHLGVHYPSDVLGGMITGAGSAWLSQYLYKKWFAKYPTKR